MANIYAIEDLIPAIDPGAFVHPTAVIIGDVIIGDGCYVGPGASLRGDFGRIVLMDGSNLQDNCVMHGFPGTDTTIEEDGHIGHGAVLHGCTIRRNALVGMNSVVMDGAEIGENGFVAAMAFVKAGFVSPANSLIAGLPAKVVRELGPEEIAWKSKGTDEYKELARRCKATLRPVTPLTGPQSVRPRYNSNIRPKNENR